MEELLTAGDVARLLRISPRKFEDMVKHGMAPPHVRMGRLRRWEPDVVRAWIEQQRLNNTPELGNSGQPENKTDSREDDMSP